MHINNIPPIKYGKNIVISYVMLQYACWSSIKLSLSLDYTQMKI